MSFFVSLLAINTQPSVGTIVQPTELDARLHELFPFLYKLQWKSENEKEKENERG